MAWEPADVSSYRPVVLPPREQRIGSVTASWFETEPGVAFIETDGGSPDDRWLARAVLRDLLGACGIRQAQYSFDASPDLRVVHVGPEDDDDLHMNMDWSDRQTFIYTPHNETLYIGQPGGHHSGIRSHPEYDEPARIEIPVGNDGSYRMGYDGPRPVLGWVEGQMPGWNSKPNMGTWGGEVPPHVVEALRPHIAPHLQQFVPAPTERNPRVKWSDVAKTAAWPDIMAKAKRLIQSGNVTLLRNGYNTIVAHVIGDHGEYTSEISRDDPTSRAITQWTCECPWDQYAFQRTRQWKKYEGRPCAHVLAAYWKSLGTPLDEDHPPGQEPGRPGGPLAPPEGPRTFSPSDAPVTQPQPGITDPQQGPSQAYQPMLPVPGQAPGAGPVGMPGAPPGGIPPSGAPMAPPAALTPPLMAPPADNGILPPFPMDPAQLQLPVSVPGGRPGPYPANPVQQPGTFSKVANVRMPTPEDFGDDWPDDVGCRTYAERVNEMNPHLRLTYGWTRLKGRKGEWGNHAWNVAPDGGIVDNYYTVHPFMQLTEDQLDYLHPESEEDEDASYYGDPPLRKRATLAHVYKVGAGSDQFVQGMAARLNEATLGQSEGREGATDAGQWMEVPKNAIVEVRDQDKTTGWVEIIYPLKGGPMTSYHVRCFVEPEKLTPMGNRPSPFQNPRRGAYDENGNRIGQKFIPWQPGTWGKGVVTQDGSIHHWQTQGGIYPAHLEYTGEHQLYYPHDHQGYLRIENDGGVSIDGGSNPEFARQAVEAHPLFHMMPERRPNVQWG